jgi:glycosyltransferase involved in cell wall biosynthesis
MSPVILPFYANRKLRVLNAALIRWQVTKIAGHLGMSCPNVVVTIPTAWEIVRGMRTASLIVNRSDKYSAFGESNRETMQLLERNLLMHADAAVYVNHELLEAERSITKPGASRFLGHGVDYERFAAATRADVPPDMQGIPSPIIGFFGDVEDYVVDLELLERLAKAIPEASVVLIGGATCDMTALTSHQNVHWLGRRPYETIPCYGAGFDVAIMPWRQNDWISNCNPIKAKEYLALGAPVVTTHYPESIYLADVMAIAQTHDDFIDLVREALAGRSMSTPERRRERVRGDSWQVRSNVLIELADLAGES